VAAPVFPAAAVTRIFGLFIRPIISVRGTMGNYRRGNQFAFRCWQRNHCISAVRDGLIETMNNHFGLLLRQWRKTRNVSQLDLAMRARISQRHVSFMESGRASPSRGMVLKLVETLDVPLRSRNDILLAAGFAPFYPESILASQEMSPANRVLNRILEHHEPYPAMVLDSGWNIVRRNQASSRIIARCVPEETLARFSRLGELNFLKLMCAPDGMRPRVRSWAHTGPALLARLRREAAAYPGSPSELLLRELLASNALPEFVESGDDPPEAVIPLELDVDGGCLRLFNTLTTFGAPQDVTLQELRIEMSFPADDATDRLLRK
jgi:transcriptional regulator with XRE-family HTH domain